jgi:hypothetical protein
MGRCASSGGCQAREGRGERAALPKMRGAGAAGLGGREGCGACGRIKWGAGRCAPPSRGECDVSPKGRRRPGAGTPRHFIFVEPPSLRAARGPPSQHSQACAGYQICSFVAHLRARAPPRAARARSSARTTPAARQRDPLRDPGRASAAHHAAPPAAPAQPPRRRARAPRSPRPTPNSRQPPERAQRPPCTTASAC